jgi:hypothetical protein
MTEEDGILSHHANPLRSARPPARRGVVVIPSEARNLGRTGRRVKSIAEGPSADRQGVGQATAPAPEGGRSRLPLRACGVTRGLGPRMEFGAIGPSAGRPGSRLRRDRPARTPDVEAMVGPRAIRTTSSMHPSPGVLGARSSESLRRRRPTLGRRPSSPDLSRGLRCARDDTGRPHRRACGRALLDGYWSRVTRHRTATRELTPSAASPGTRPGASR